MKLSDYIANFLVDLGVRHVFAITGGASLHMIDSLSKTPGIEYVCTHHEQAAAMAADSYSRVTSDIGVAVSTSGPGATNLITGICCSWYDSVPVLYITGQVSTFRFKSDSGVRQMGFQETDIVGMCASITKHAVTLCDPRLIRCELEQAVWLAKQGRPGPVLLDIPDNLQRENIDPDELMPFVPPIQIESDDNSELQASVRQCLDWISEAERPIMVFGWGVRLANAEDLAVKFAERMNIPLNPTWATADLLPSDHPLIVGTFGTHGTRYGNFAIQNADLVISVGSRLDTHMIGSPFSTFAREAKKVVVDVDPAEVAKFPRFGLPIDLPVVADAGDFLEEVLRQSEGETYPSYSDWKSTIANWKQRYQQGPASYLGYERLDPYVFTNALADSAKDGEIVISDTGCAIAWLCQAFRFKANQRLLHAFNNTPMGYALPASIGASLALGRREIICVVGDGGLMVNIQELSTVLYHQLPIKIFVLDNQGYSMIQQTQDQWLGSRYEGSSEKCGLGFPDFGAMAAALGFKTFSISTNGEALERVKQVMAEPGPVFCTVSLLPEKRVVPQVKYGRPIEDPEPLLDRDEFFANMIVAPMDVSK